MTGSNDCPSRRKPYARRYDKLRRFGYHQTVDGTITRRKLEALQALGWSLTDIGREIGRAQQSLSETLHHREAPVHRATVKAIDEVYERWQFQVNTTDYATRTIARARRLGYAPPAAYDCIDDPNDKPKGIRR